MTGSLARPVPDVDGAATVRIVRLVIRLLVLAGASAVVYLVLSVFDRPAHGASASPLPEPERPGVVGVGTAVPLPDPVGRAARPVGKALGSVNDAAQPARSASDAPRSVSGKAKSASSAGGSAGSAGGPRKSVSAALAPTDTAARSAVTPKEPSIKPIRSSIRTVPDAVAQLPKRLSPLPGAVAGRTTEALTGIAGGPGTSTVSSTVTGLATTRPTGTLIAPVADLVGSTVDEVAGAVDETVAGPVSQTLTGTGTGTGTGTVAGVLGEVSAGAGAASSLLPADPGGPATVAPSPGTAGRLLPDPVPGALSPVGLPSPRPAMPVLTAPVSPAVARGVARTVAQSCQWADSTGRQSNTTSSTPASPESPVEPWPRPGERPVEVTLTQMVGGGGYPSPVFAIVGGCWLPALTACPGDALAHVNGRGRFILHGRLPG